MKWHRLIVPTGHEQLIPTVHRPWQYAGRDQVLREARLCAENVGGIDSEAAEIIDIITRKIKLGGEEEKANHAKLLCVPSRDPSQVLHLFEGGRNDDVTRVQTCGNHLRRGRGRK